MWRCLGLGFFFMLAASGCDGPVERVVVYTSVDDVFARPILAAFTAETGIRVDALYDVEAAKTTGLYHRLLAEKKSPRADVFWNSEVARTVALAQAGVLSPYVSPSASGIPDSWRGAGGAWTGFAVRARVLLYNLKRVPAAERPRSIQDLASARFRGEAGMALPLFGTAATHMAALRVRLGAARMEAYCRALEENGVQFLAGNALVRDRVALGELKIGIADSDDAQVAVAKGMPVGIVFPDQEALYPGLPEPLGTFIIPNTVSLIAGGPEPQLGKRLVDYLLRPETEAALARGESAQIPVRPGIAPPSIPGRPERLIPMEVAYEALAAAMEESTRFLEKLILR